MDRSLDELARLLDGDDLAAAEDVDDALRAAMHWLYDLWEALGRSRGRPNKSVEDSEVKGDAAGETCASIVFARGEFVHAKRVVGGQALGFGEGHFGEGPFGGGWMWPAWPVMGTSRYPDREEWYARHVAQHSLITPPTVAVAWLRQQRELRP